VIVEKYITGYDHRILVINYKFVAAAKRTPASVVGDGKSTIRELIDKVNSDPRRGYGHEKVLTAIKVDDFTMNILTEKGWTLDYVLPAGEELLLKPTANISTGGTATDITDLVHPDNVFMCERIAHIIGLDICGIDIMTPDLSQPIGEVGGAILEVNAAPGFRMHLAPTDGLPRNVAEPSDQHALSSRQHCSYSHHCHYRDKRKNNHHAVAGAHCKTGGIQSWIHHH
jgi:cyanophycin synthetase